MNFYNTGNRYNSFNDQEEGEEDTGENVFRTMRTKKKEKATSDTMDDRFKFKSSFDSPPTIIAKEFTVEISAFPELSSSSKPPPSTTFLVKDQEKNSFISKLNKPQIIKIEPPPQSSSHWVTITLNKKTGVMTYMEPQSTKETIEQETRKESKLVIKALTDLHIRRTNNYIKSWGQDEHYRTFYSTNF